MFVRKGTLQEVVNVLQSAFMKAYEDPKFDEFARTMGGGLTGNDAVQYIRQNQSVSAWLLYDVGGAKSSPEQFGIPRP